MAETSADRLVDALADPSARDDSDLAESAVKCPQESPGTLRVTVLRDDDLTGVPGVAVEAGDRSTVSNASGVAAFGAMPSGPVRIAASLSGEQRRAFAPGPGGSATIAAGTEATETLRLEPIVTLNIIVSAWNSTARLDAPCVGVRWTIDGPIVAKGETGGDGRISVEMPYAAASASLTITYPEPRKRVGPPRSPVASANDYPPPIQHARWLDPTNDVSSTPLIVRWQLFVTDLSELDSDDGHALRLANLGFDVSDRVAAVRAYQRSYLAQPDGTGALSEIRQDLVRRHDVP